MLASPAMTVLPLALAAALAAKGPFDAPKAKQEVELPADAQGPAAKLRCTVYRAFVVKELDRGEKGAARLTLVRYDPAGAVPPCDLAFVPGEVEVEGWSGHFAGARGRFVFFAGDDGWEAGSTGFAVYDARTGRKVFEDAAVPGPEKLVLEPDGEDLKVKFRRAWRAPCSLVKDPAGCWKRIRGALALPGDAPVCTASYARAKAPPEDPSVLTYDAEVPSLTARRVRAAAAPKAACEPGM